MYVLGIEGATPVASVAVAGEGKILAERSVDNLRTHSINLMPMIRDVLADAGLGRGDLGGVAVSSGPGSFTGLRISMSTAKTLAQVWRLPIAGISTFDVLAYPLAGHGSLLCPILNARKNEVYAALYDASGGEPALLAGPLAVGLEELARLLGRHEGRVSFLGDGAPVFREELADRLGERVQFLPRCASFPRGAAVAELGWRFINTGRGADPLALLPQYVRQSEAEVKWQEKHGAG